MAVRRFTVALIVLSLGLAACGRDVQGLLKRESRRAWDADQLVVMAEDLDAGLEQPVYAAESAKQKACADFDKASRERMEYFGEMPFWQALWSDFSRFVLLFLPWQSVEDCARAHARYNEEINLLGRRLKDSGVDIAGPD
jgi:hypothetical protein